MESSRHGNGQQQQDYNEEHRSRNEEDAARSVNSLQCKVNGFWYV
jgi:hypothetical protein